MELKSLLSKFVYRIEPKPEGGFIARSSDASVPPIEAPTREELQRKIRETIAASLGNAFPGLKSPQGGQPLNISFHIEHKPDGTFDIHSGDPASASIQGASSEEVESHFAEKMLSLVGKHLSPEFSQELGAQLASGNVKVFVNKGGHHLSVTLGAAGAATTDTMTTGGQAMSDPQPGVGSNAVITNSSFQIANDNSPIKPGGESNPIFRFLFAALIVLGVIFALIHFHH